jgi:hypothetical protein
MSRGIHPGLAPLSHPLDPTRSDAASRWVLRELRRVSRRPPPEFVPPLELVALPNAVTEPLPAWAKPAPRRSHVGRQVYRPQTMRRHPVLRFVCRVLPFLAPVARRVL